MGEGEGKGEGEGEGKGEGEGEVGGFKSEMIIKIHCSQEYMFFKNLNVCF